jgi:hypothetical protein
MRLTCLTIASAVSCLLLQASPGSAETSFPEKKGHKQYAGCPENNVAVGTVPAVDISDQIDTPTFEGLKDTKVKLVFRYYDWEDDLEKPPPKLKQPFSPQQTPFSKKNGFTYSWREGPSWRGKGLTSDELTKIHNAGLLVGVVFQHYNSSIKTFLDRGRPKFDANRALVLAAQFNQPSETVIFFGADNSFSKKDYKHIEDYFRVVNDIVTRAHFKVGVYGEGYVCEKLKEKGLASHCWLSQSTGPQFLDSVSYAASGKWQVKQCAERWPFKGSPTTIDPDLLKVDLKEIGF